MAKIIKKIVAIGGGEIKDFETLTIDKELIRLTGKKHPKLLFIPTASSDSEGYCVGVKKYFGEKLSCKVDVLLLLNGELSTNDIKKKILNSDIIYVGGGNTLKMMRVWRKLGVDKILKTAWERGVVLSGLSAGSICWFDSGHSDSMAFYNAEDWKYINVKGLGFIKGVHCPHYDTETLGAKRRTHFAKLIKKVGGIGIAIDENCAIEFLDDAYRVISSKKHAKAYKVYKKGGEVVSDEIEQRAKYSPVSELYKKE